MSAPGPSSAQFNQQIGNQVLDWLEGLFANGLNQANRIGTPEGDHSYRADMRMHEPFESAGYGPQAAGLLGLLGLLATPDPTDIMQLAKVANRASGAASEVANRVPVRSPSGVTEEVLYRAERADGAGGLFGYNGTNPRGTYFTNDPEYLQAASRVWDDHNYPVDQFRVRHARPAPRQGSFLDVTGDSAMDWDLWGRVEDRLLRDFAGDGAEFQRARIQNIFEEARQGLREPYDLMADIQHLYRHPDAAWPGRVPQAAGSSVEGALRDAGVDLIRQFPDDNAGAVIRRGVGDRREYVAINSDAIQPFQQES
jgi:hypothetical protein